MSERLVLPCPEHIINGFYLHHKGGRFEVYGLSQDEATGVWHVLYRNPQSGLPWHMPASRFVQKFTLID